MFRVHIVDNVRKYCRLSIKRLSSSRVEVRNVDEKGFIKHVLLNRPDKQNALDLEMFESIGEVATNLQGDHNTRVILISGAGKSFSTGLDINSIKIGNASSTIERLLKRPSGYGKQSYDQNEAVGNLAQDVAYLWRNINVPVIAAIHGKCFGGGLQIALGADIRFATPDSSLSIMECKWGLIPDMTASITLRELVRIDVAKELTFTGRVVTGEEAARLGLVTRCVTDPVAEATTLAHEIVSRSPDAVAAAKRLFQDTWMASEKECLEHETKLQKTLLVTWNQMIASGRNYGFNLPFLSRKD